MKEHPTSLRGSDTALAPERSTQPHGKRTLPCVGATEGILEFDPTPSAITREDQRVHSRLSHGDLERHPELVRGAMVRTASRSPVEFFCSTRRVNENRESLPHARETTESAVTGQPDQTFTAQLHRLVSELQTRVQRLTDLANGDAPTGLFDRRWIP